MVWFDVASTEHLMPHQTAAPAGGEWTLPTGGWVFLHSISGSGYWRQPPRLAEFNPGDTLAIHIDGSGTLLASRLGPLQFHWFSVCPEFLSNILGLEEQAVLDAAARRDAVRRFPAGHSVANLHERLIEAGNQPRPLQRVRMIEILASAFSNEFTAAVPNEAGPIDARARLRQWLARIPESDLIHHSVDELARSLNCSVRHFSRLFRDEVGLPFRDKQTELRLMKARHLLVDSNAKVIHVALESGYRHLGLFNTLFKRRFGMTPTQWRRQIQTAEPRRRRSGGAAANAWIGVLGAIAGLGLALGGAPTLLAQTTPAAASTNAPAAATTKLSIKRYEVVGNTLLSPSAVQAATSDFTGENVDFQTLRQALASLQLAYRGRGFATVSVSLPQQKLTNGVVRIQVTEGRLTEIRVQGNRWFSSNNVRSSLPGLTTNLFLNSKLLQAELDLANANRDRQIYPQIQPGPEPGTSSMLLKVKDQFPVHGRFELNNQATPDTPELRGSASAQYNNLWQLEHSIGLSYGFTLEQFKGGDANLFDQPSLANYSAFYRMPLGPRRSLPAEVDANPGRFGYDESSHQFRLPPTMGRPELNFFVSRSTTDTGIKLTSLKEVNPPPIALYSQDSGQDLSTTESVGFRLSVPLREFRGIKSTLTLGADLKRYHRASFNTNNFLEDFTYRDPSTGQDVHRQIPFSSPQPPSTAALGYMPVAVRWDGFRPDSKGSTSLGAGANVNVPGGPFSGGDAFRKTSGAERASGQYVTLQANAARDQRLYEDWTVSIRADGQWANQPLVSNEQFGVGGTAGVRGYREGERYGDTGWRTALEPRTPLIDIGMVDGTAPFRIRGFVFTDYGESYLLDPGHPTATISGYHPRETFWGAGAGFSGSIGSSVDFRLTVGWALKQAAGVTTGASGQDILVKTRAGDLQLYFGIGAQF